MFEVECQPKEEHAVFKVVVSGFPLFVASNGLR